MLRCNSALRSSCLSCTFIHALSWSDCPSGPSWLVLACRALAWSLPDSSPHALEPKAVFRSNSSSTAPRNKLPRPQDPFFGATGLPLPCVWLLCRLFSVLRRAATRWLPNHHRISQSGKDAPSRWRRGLLARHSLHYSHSATLAPRLAAPISYFANPGQGSLAAAAPPRPARTQILPPHLTTRYTYFH